MNHLVVLDTNVVVSAGLSDKGAPAAILEKSLAGELVVVTCPSIVEEYWAVLKRPKFKRFGFPPLWLDGLLFLAHHMPHDPPIWPHKGPDPDDLVFLALAKQMGAVLITGNAKDYPASIRGGVSVVSPKAYLEAL